MILASISFITVIGGTVYEHAAVVPVWSAAVPASLAMFQGEYALAAGRFWIPVHPTALALLVIAMVANWRSERRAFILLPLGGYAAVLFATFIYFVPELMAITQPTYSATLDAVLTGRAHTLEALSLVRLAFLILLAITLLFGLTKPAESTADLD